MYDINIRWAPYHQGKVPPQAEHGGDSHQIWKVAATILSKQSQTPEKVWSSSLGVGGAANNSP
jgi:hypothetical protein